MKVKYFFLTLFIFILPSNLLGETKVENENHQMNLFIGNFDFSDDKQKATLLGFQHQEFQKLFRLPKLQC